MINSISPVSAAPQLLRSAPAASAAVSGPSFKSVLLQSMEQTRLMQGADETTKSAITHAMGSMQKADLTLSAATQIHHALSRAYDEIRDIHG